MAVSGSMRSPAEAAFFEQRPDQMPLGKLIPCVSSVITRYFHHVVAEHGLTRTSLAVLGALAAQDGLSHRELAEHVLLTPATLTPVLDALEGSGDIRRDRDPEDRRVVRLHLTDLGRLRFGAAAGVVAAAFRTRMPHPSPEQEKIIRDYLLDVLAALGTPASEEEQR